jgi:hypothetical protein
MGSIKRYIKNLRRVLLFLGLPLLITVVLGLAAEAWLQDIRVAQEEILPPSWTPLLPFAKAFTAMRMALPVIVGLTAIPALLTPLFRKIYAVKDAMAAHDSLHRVTFGPLGTRPFVIINEGRIAVGENIFAGRVGGPATFIIYEDSAIVTEQYGKLKRVLGPGIHPAERFEKVWEVIDLRPQRWVLPVFGLTKEGIPINCEADLAFQINDQPSSPESKRMGGAYPFTEEAILLAATAKWIRDPDLAEQQRTWAGRVVIGFAEGLLRNILAEYRLDWLLAPPQPGQPPPREEIQRRFEEGLHQRVGKVGAKLLHVRIGQIEVKARNKETSEELAKIVPKQWIDAWHAGWEAKALESTVEGQAELLRMDMARVQAQTEMVVTLTEALQSTLVTQGTVEPYLVALRFVETLRWMSYNTINHEFMPPEALRTLRQIQKLIGPGAKQDQDQEKAKEAERKRT